MSLPLRLTKIRQKASHRRLLRSVDPLIFRPSRLHAIIVPATRPVESFVRLIDLSARLGVLLVVLCSRQAIGAHVADQVAATRGARALVVDVPAAFRLKQMPKLTSTFASASGGRRSDLSTKRNLGLLLARLNGWTKVAFLDDDITHGKTNAFTRLARQLDSHHIAGMICRQYPDNSVVCHARRLSGLPQDNFVSGSALGVRCDDRPLPFFPDIYNEDWFFFSEAAAKHELISVGDTTQSAFDPFANPERARHEEFGDLLAEGLYALIGDIADPRLPYHRVLERADAKYWAAFIGARHESLHDVRRRLERAGNDYGRPALRSLAVAEAQLATITPRLCADFIDAWKYDLEEWHATCTLSGKVRSVREAMTHFPELPWQLAQHGDAYVDGTADTPTLTLPVAV
jgi:hypothetical protein